MISIASTSLLATALYCGVFATSQAVSYCNTRKVKIQSSTGEFVQVFEVEIYASNGNVAIGKSATQSSDFEDYYAPLAIDGDLQTFSHTNDNNSFLEVDLGDEFPVESISIKNRWCIDESDAIGCLCRLSGALLSITDNQGTVIGRRQIPNTCGVPEVNFDFSCNPSSFVARKVKIISTTSAAIHVFELEVYSTGSGENVALGKSTSQSSAFQADLISDNAVDGDIDTFSHTNFNVGEYLEVDLGIDIPIEYVSIKNRWCGDENDATGCLCRLSGAILYLLDDFDVIVAQKQLGDTCGDSVINIEFATVVFPTMKPSTSAPTPKPSRLPTNSPSKSPISKPGNGPTKTKNPASNAGPNAKYMKY